MRRLNVAPSMTERGGALVPDIDADSPPKADVCALCGMSYVDRLIARPSSNPATRMVRLRLAGKRVVFGPPVPVCFVCCFNRLGSWKKVVYGSWKKAD